MEKIGPFKLLKKYIWHNRYVAFSFLSFAAIFAIIFMLYNTPLETVIYAFFLCTMIAGIIGCVRFYFYYKRHKDLMRVLKNPTLLIDDMPQPDDLIEEDLQAIIKKLQKINVQNYTKWQSKRTESIDYYTSWVHQIKTPISVIRLILQEEDTKENRELSLQLFRVEQYVEMVLSYFRLDSESSDFVFKKYSVDNIIKSVIRKYAGQFVIKQLGLKYDGTDLTTVTDEKWLEFILEQIISNAIKYTEKGFIKIEVKDEAIYISDTGIGIAAEDLPRIFERGFTGYNGRSDKKATGLGLYLCKKAADKLSHRISVNSQVGRGTTFKIDLSKSDVEFE